MTKDDIETQLEESKKFELKAGYVTYADGSSLYLNSNTPINEGLCFPTTETSKIASKNRLKRDRLEAYSRQIDPYYVVGFDNWFILQRFDGKYEINCSVEYKTLGAVYMSKKAAEILRDALNNNEIEL